MILELEEVELLVAREREPANAFEAAGPVVQCMRQKTDLRVAVAAEAAIGVNGERLVHPHRIQAPLPGSLARRAERDRMFAFLEGDHTFNLIYGLATGAVCLALAIPIL